MEENDKKLIRADKKLMEITQIEIKKYLEASKTDFNERKIKAIDSDLRKNLTQQFNTLEDVQQIQPEQWQELIKQSIERVEQKYRSKLNNFRSITVNDHTLDKYLMEQITSYYKEMGKSSITNIVKTKLPLLRTILIDAGVINYGLDSPSTMHKKLQELPQDAMKSYIEKATKIGTFVNSSGIYRNGSGNDHNF